MSRQVYAIGEKWFSDYVEKNVPSLEGKVIAITGTTSGTGFYAVIAGIRKGVDTFFLLNRPSERVEKSCALLEKEIERCKASTKLVKIDCDLKSFASVKKAAQQVEERARALGGLNLLINNAGIAYFPDVRTEDGYEVQMQVNYLSHYILTCALFDVLNLAAEKTGEARVVNHSSSVRYATSFAQEYMMKNKEGELGGNGGYGMFMRYFQSKVAFTAFSYELNRRFKALGSKVICTLADPGLATTDIIEKLGGEAQQQTMSYKAVATVFTFLCNYVVPKQSAADGAMPLVGASFVKNTGAGDFYVPGGIGNCVGIPVKAIEGETPTGKYYKEKNILDAAVGKQVWDLAKEATGCNLS